MQPVDPQSVQPKPLIQEMNGTADEARMAVYIAQAERCWRAEEVNSARIAQRANLVLSGITAVIGLKLYSASREISLVLEVGLDPLTVTFWVTIVIALGLMLLCLRIILEIRWPTRWPWQKPRLNPSASKALQPSQEHVGTPLKRPISAIQLEAFENTYAAALDLYARNKNRGMAVDIAQGRFFIAVLLLFVGLVVYAVIEAREIARAKDPAYQTSKQSAP